MSTRRTEADILAAKRSPQVGIMHQLVKKVKGPFCRAILDIQMNRVRKDGTLEEAREVQATVAEILVNEIKRLTENEVPVATHIDNVPNEGACYIINAVGSLMNLSAGQSNICITLAYVKNNVCESTVVYFPLTERLYIAEKGHGVDGPDFKLRVSGKEVLENAIVGFFSPISKTENEDEVVETFTKLRKSGSHVRMSGNTIADILDASSGQLDAYIGYNLNALDVMVAELIAREAGAYTCEVDGSKAETGSTTLVISNHKMQARILKTLAA